MSANPPFEPPQPPARGRLIRTRGDRMVAGVAGGLGRYFGIDPVIVRIALVVLAFIGGAGLLLYLAAVLLVPNEDEVPGGAGPAAPQQRTSALVILGIVAVVVVFGAILGPIAIFATGVFVPLLFLMLIGLGVAWLVTGRRPEREAGSIARATFLGLGVVVLLGALAIASFWGAGIGGDVVVAVAVIAAGAAVVVAAFVKPARWLVLPALALALPAAFVSAAGIDLDGGIGERTYRPGSVTAVERQYEIGIGQVVVDLRGVDFPAGDHRLDLDVGMGEAVVVVPEDLCVTTNADVGMGQADVFDRGTGGVDVDYLDGTVAERGEARLVLDADVGVGHLDLRKTDPGFRDWPERMEQGPRPPEPPFGGRDGDFFDDDRGVNDACAA